MNEEEFQRFLGEMAKQDTALTAITTKIGEFSKQLATVVSRAISIPRARSWCRN